MMGKWRRKIKYNCVLRIRCDDSGGILAVMRPVGTLDERPDIGSISRRLNFYGCS